MHNEMVTAVTAAQLPCNFHAASIRCMEVDSHSRRSCNHCILL